MNTFLGHLVDLSRIVIVSSYVVTSEVCLGSQPKLKYTLCIVSVSHLNYKVPEEHLWFGGHAGAQGLIYGLIVKSAPFFVKSAPFFSCPKVVNSAPFFVKSAPFFSLMLKGYFVVKFAYIGLG